MTTSSSLDDRIAELGLTLPEVAAPVAAYAPAVVSGKYVYTAGQLPFVDGALPATGVVSETEGENHVSPERAKELAARRSS